MKSIDRIDVGTTVLAVRAPTGLVTRGDATVKTAKRGLWELIVEDFSDDQLSTAKVSDVLSDAEREPIQSVLRHFRHGNEVFALIGPPGVIAGAAPDIPAGSRATVWVEANEGLLAMGLEPDGGFGQGGWLSVGAGRAVCWGPQGPEVFCDLRRGAVWDALLDARETYWTPEDSTAA